MTKLKDSGGRMLGGRTVWKNVPIMGGMLGLESRPLQGTFTGNVDGIRGIGMRMMAKWTGGLLLLWGISLSAVGMIGIRNADRETRNAAMTALFVLGLPPVAVGSGLWLWSRQGAKRQLKQTFFRLLQDNAGKITVLHFAMETGLEGEVAKAYLDERAVEFNATFEATEQGAVTYVFELDQPFSPGIDESDGTPEGRFLNSD